MHLIYKVRLPDRFFVILRSQTIYGSLVETFGPYFQVYTMKLKCELNWLLTTHCSDSN